MKNNTKNNTTTKKFKPVIRYFDMAILTNGIIDGTLQISILTPNSKLFRKGYGSQSYYLDNKYEMKIRDGGEEENLGQIVCVSTRISNAVIKRIFALASHGLEKELAQKCLVFTNRASNFEEAKKIVDDIQQKYDEDVASQKLLEICVAEDMRVYLMQDLFYAAKLTLDEYNRVNA